MRFKLSKLQENFSYSEKPDGSIIVYDNNSIVVQIPKEGYVSTDIPSREILKSMIDERIVDLYKFETYDSNDHKKSYKLVATHPDLARKEAKKLSDNKVRNFRRLTANEI